MTKTQYSGSHGIDFDTNLAIDTIDFGTFHVCCLVSLSGSVFTDVA